MGNTIADSGAGQFAVAAQGTLVYVTGGVHPTRPASSSGWTAPEACSRSAHRTGQFGAPALSPDGSASSCSAGHGERRTATASGCTTSTRRHSHRVDDPGGARHVGSLVTRWQSRRLLRRLGAGRGRCTRDPLTAREWPSRSSKREPRHKHRVRGRRPTSLPSCETNPGNRCRYSRARRRRWRRQGSDGRADAGGRAAIPPFRQTASGWRTSSGRVWPYGGVRAAVSWTWSPRADLDGWRHGARRGEEMVGSSTTPSGQDGRHAHDGGRRSPSAESSAIRRHTAPVVRGSGLSNTGPARGYDVTPDGQRFLFVRDHRVPPSASASRWSSSRTSAKN